MERYPIKLLALLVAANKHGHRTSAAVDQILGRWVDSAVKAVNEN
jgi:hypothetical protein